MRIIRILEKLKLYTQSYPILLRVFVFDVHNELGRYAREKQYADLLEAKLKQATIPYKRELRVGQTGNIVDFVIENKIILKLKAKGLILKDDYYQVQRYLQILKIKLGLIVNFANRYLKPIRVVRIDTDARRKFLK